MRSKAIWMERWGQERAPHCKVQEMFFEELLPRYKRTQQRRDSRLGMLLVCVYCRGAISRRKHLCLNILFKAQQPSNTPSWRGPSTLKRKTAPFLECSSWQEWDDEIFVNAVRPWRSAFPVVRSPSTPDEYYRPALIICGAKRENSQIDSLC